MQILIKPWSPLDISRDICLSFDLGCLEVEFLEFLLAHHTSNDQDNDQKTMTVMDKSFDTLNSPDVSSEDKKRFLKKLRSDLGQWNEIQDWF